MILDVKSVSKVFNLDNERITALKNVNFSLQEGEFLTFIGPSGCGKSTLLRILAGLDSPTSGEITWQKDHVIGMVFQYFALFPYLTVFENIEFGLKMKGVPPQKRKTIANELIQEMGLTEFSSKHPKELSGGMKQRVGIARSLAISPTILLLDEPFSSLDEFTADSLRKLLLSIWEKRKITVVLITHLVKEAIELSTRIAVMSSAPGTIQEIIPNSLPRPRNLRSQTVYQLEDNLTKKIHHSSSLQKHIV